VSVETLPAAFETLAPWPPDRDLTREEWGAYIEAARLVGKTDPTDLDATLARALDRGDADDETRLFLLSRVVFDLPSRAPADQRRTWKGWLNWPEVDADGTVNLSWPVRWDESGPSLSGRYAGSEGPRYAAVEEYRDLRERFPLRELPG
jgi:hypothetical protein